MLKNLRKNGCMYLIILDMFFMNLFPISRSLSLGVKIFSGLILLKISLENKVSLKKIIIFLILLLIVFINYNQMKLNFIYILLFIYNLNKFKDIEKNIFKIVIVLLLINIIFLYIGLISNEISLPEGRIRNSYGFNHPNLFSLFYFFIGVYLWKFNKFYIKAFSIFFMWYIYIKTDSRTQFMGFCIFILLLVGNQFFSKNKLLKLKKIIKKIVLVMILVINYLYLYMGINFDKFPKIDKIVSLRLWYIKKVFDDMSFFEYILGSSKSILYPIDNSLLVFNYSYGVIVSNLFFIYLIYWILKNIEKYSDFEYALICSCLIMAIFESFLLRLPNPITIYFYWSILNKGEAVNYN